MKIVTLFIAAILTCTLHLSTFPGEVYGGSTKAASAASKTASKSGAAMVHDVNINSADKEQLIQLPGIGPVTAEAILSYRKSHGKFKSVDQLTEVKGIGDKTLAKLRPYLKKI